MKKLLPLFLLVLTTITFSQNISVVPGDGTLKQAINSAPAGATLLLAPGQVYTESVDTVFLLTKSLTFDIDGPAGSVKPKVQMLTPNTTNTVNFFGVKAGVALTVRNIEFDGRNNGVITTSRFIRYYENTTAPTNIGTTRIENCYIHHILKDVFDGNSPAQGNIILDSLIVRGTFTHDTGPVVHLKQIDARYVGIKNSTFTNFNDYGIRIMGIYGQTITPTVEVDHITMDNVLLTSNNKLYLVWGEGTSKPWTFTYCIFTNTWTPTWRTDKGLYWKNCSAGVTFNHCRMYKDGNRSWNPSSTSTTVTAFDTLSVDPLYADTAARNYRLPVGSAIAAAGIGDPRWFPTAIREVSPVANDYTLEQNYPNPFNPTTYINFSLKDAGFVTLNVFNSVGQVVETLVSQNMSAGKHQVDFDASKLTSGVYYYTLKANTISLTKKMVVLK